MEIVGHYFLLEAIPRKEQRRVQGRREADWKLSWSWHNTIVQRFEVQFPLHNLTFQKGKQLGFNAEGGLSIQFLLYKFRPQRKFSW